MNPELAKIVTDFNAEQPAGYYLLEHGHLGGGGQAQVFAGGKSGQPDTLAVKIVQSPDAITSELFTSETQAMHRLGDHPNIAAVHFAGKLAEKLTPEQKTAGRIPQQYLYAVMDRAHGTVAGEMQRACHTTAGRIPTRVAVQYVLDIIAGVGHAHGERPDGSRQEGGIVHRDIKPANALLFPAPETGRPAQVKLSDFGIARKGYGHPLAITQTHVGAGTVLYADPRQFREGGALFAHDQYMTAAAGLHILTGVAPFEEYGHSQSALVNAHIEVPVPVRAMRLPNGSVDLVAEHVQEVLVPAMHKKISDRYESMVALGDRVWEAAARGETAQKRQRTHIDLGSVVGWRIPMDDVARNYISAAQYQDGPKQTQRRGISRRVLLGGITGLAVVGGTSAAWFMNRETGHATKGPSNRPEASPSPSTFDERLTAAFDSKPPELRPFTGAERLAARESVDRVTHSIAECLKKWKRADQMVTVVSALAEHDPDTAFSLWQWIETQGWPNSEEPNTNGLADPHAWAAAALAPVKPDQMAQILTSEAWSDKIKHTGVNDRENDVRGANRGVLGCALARLRPAAVKKILNEYQGSSPTATGFTDAMSLALEPKQKGAARILRDLGLEEAPAAALSLAYGNPDLLIREMSEYRDTWGISPSLFARAVTQLLPKHVDFVSEIVQSKKLDAIKATFDTSDTLEASVRCAAVAPQIAADIFKIRRKETTRSSRAILAVALAGYKPALTEAVLSEQPNNTLIQLALDPTNVSLRNSALEDLNRTLQNDPQSLGILSFLAAAFIGAQRKRLS